MRSPGYDLITNKIIKQMSNSPKNNGSILTYTYTNFYI